MPKKSPYRNFTIEQVRQAEEDSYVLQIGYELFYEGDYCAFPKAKIDRFYEFIRAGLEDLIKNGTKEEQEDAISSCLNLRIIPLRIQ